MKFKTLLETKKLTLEVTMPQTIEYVEAAIKGGADALKMRVNKMQMDALSAGVENGTFQERKAFIQEVIDMANGIPVGLVPGGKERFVSEEEVVEMEEMGVDYFVNSYWSVPTYMFESKVLTKVIATTDEDKESEILKGISEDPNVDVVEANFVPPSEFATPLVYGDILRHRAFVKTVKKPVIATAQRVMRPQDVRHFYEAGCKAFMLGIILFNANGDMTPESVMRTVDAFRNEIEKL
ncbi:MAG: hypothetical protein LBQ95_06375 [Lachnospiraceae bacterium]|jgi:hypothetical protein|nr:hypothetical protein [Lachnospiraceae bacterium]